MSPPPRTDVNLSYSKSTAEIRGLNVASHSFAHSYRSADIPYKPAKPAVMNSVNLRSEILLSSVTLDQDDEFLIVLRYVSNAECLDIRSSRSFSKTQKFPFNVVVVWSPMIYFIALTNAITPAYALFLFFIDRSACAIILWNLEILVLIVERPKISAT